MSAAIFSLIPEEKLCDLLKTLSDCLDIPVQLLDEQGNELHRCGKQNGYCGMLKKTVFRNNECLEVHRKAGERAHALGESYIFACHANLNHIAFPLQSHGELLGTIIVGPFLMDTPDSTLITEVAEGHSLAAADCLSLYDELQGLRVVAPARVGQISRLIDYLLTPLLPSEQLLLLEKQEKLYQQSRINETVQRYKGDAGMVKDEYPYEKERELLVKVKTGDVHAAKAILNDLLGYVLFSEGGKIEIIKSRALELTTLLSRVSIEGGAQPESIYHLNHQFLSRIRSMENYEMLCYQLQEVVESFVSAVSLRDAHSANPNIREAVRHIAENYAEPLTLEQLADVAGLSASYFSALFTKTMGMGCRDYINHVRVEEAKRLLTATDYPLSQIALSVGYSDQSYFSKVFKRTTGLSPNRFR